MARPTAWNRMRESDQEWDDLNPPYQLGRSEQRRRFGQRAIKGPPSMGTTPSEVADRAKMQRPGEINKSGMTPESIWREKFKRYLSIPQPLLNVPRRTSTPSLAPESPPNANAFASLYNAGKQAVDYMGSTISNAVDFMKRSPIFQQLQRNNLGYDPIDEPVLTDEEY